MNKKIFCCICHKEIIDYKPTRLYKFKYGAGNYNQYSEIEHWNFCKRCYKSFENWINKYKEK